MAKTMEALVDGYVGNAALTNDAEGNAAIRDAVAYREAGGRFISADEFKARMKAAIKEYADVCA